MTGEVRVYSIVTAVNSTSVEVSIPDTDRLGSRRGEYMRHVYKDLVLRALSAAEESGTPFASVMYKSKLVAFVQVHPENAL